MGERRLGDPRTVLERAARHFGIPEGEVTLAMLNEWAAEELLGHDKKELSKRNKK